MSNWKNYSSWDTVLPPNRPGKTEVEFLRTCLLDANKDSAIVLGATPEYRNLLKILKFKKIVVIEKNISFLKSISHLSIQSEAETIVEGDWLEILPKFKGQYSLVVSDITLGNIPFEQQSDLQKLMCDALKPDGILFDRILHYRDGLCNWDLIGETFRYLPLNLETVNLFSIMALFRSPVIKNIGKLDTTIAYDTVVKKHYFLKKISNLTKKYVTPTNCIWWYNGIFKNPLKTYSNFLTSSQEINYHSRGFNRNISIVLGKK